MAVRKKSPINAVIESYFEKRWRPKLTVRKLDKDTVLFETTAKGFEFLGRIFLAHAREHDCGFEVSPKGAGNAWFTKDATLGLYFHRLPCNSRGGPKWKWRRSAKV